MGMLRALAAGLAAGLVMMTGPAIASAAALSSGQPHIVHITGVDDRYQIDTSGTVQAGLTRIVFANRGSSPHQAQLLLLHPGVPFATFKHDLLSGNVGAALGGDAVPWGGVSVTAPHHDQVIYEALQGGTYAVVCFVANAMGVPHFAMGMITSFTVAGHLSPSALARLRPAVAVAGQVTAHDMTYSMPATLHNGGLYQFRDTDRADAHELNLGRLLPGKTLNDARAWFRKQAGPPPFTAAGGAGAWVPGGLSTWFTLSAAPGRYIAFCLVPDSTGKTHAAMGMVVAFTVG